MSNKTPLDDVFLKPESGSAQSPRHSRSIQEYKQQASLALEQGYTHIPLVRETLADLDTPVSTYMKLANQPYSYLFESVQGGSRWGRYSIIGLACETIFRFNGNQLTTQTRGGESDCVAVEDPLQKIRELQSAYKVFEYPGLPDMIGGLVGYFSYETIAHIEPKLAHILSVDNTQQDDLETPDIMLMESTEVVVFDNLSGRIFIVVLAELNDESAFNKAQKRLAEIEESLREPILEQELHNPSQKEGSTYFSHFDRELFENSVEQCREYIRNGDLMQVVLSQRLSTDFSGSSLDLYRALRTINPSPYMYYLNMGDFQIVGSSPEILVRLEDNKVTLRPIAGTRKRGATPELDLSLEQELLSDQKEIAEHVMLIDLGRNDIGRIAQIGSVELTERMIIERYSHVMHIVSNVEGELREGLDAIDVLRATFPAGTVSGAPKIRAMQIISELEPCKRGVYSGAVGYLGWNGNMDTAISIRTAVVKDGTLYVQAGAGIVADSVPQYEWKETLSKARVMINAVNMANSGLGFNKSSLKTAESTKETTN